MEQRSEEWFQARCGSLGASKIGKALEMLKKSGEWNKDSVDFMFELAAERLTGPTKRVNTLQWGIDYEDEARAAYALMTNAEVAKVGLIRHPTISYAHASPDALVGDDGGLEIKCPTPATHLKTLYYRVVPEENLPQMYWGMACSGRAWWDFVSYDPRFPPHLQLFIKRVERDEQAIKTAEANAIKWLADLDDKLKMVAASYPAEAA